MKKIIAGLLFILFQGVIFSQSEMRPKASLTEHFSMNNIITEIFGSNIRTLGPHAGTFGEIGISLETNKVEYSILGSYGVEIVLGEEKYRSHLLGLNLEFRFQKEKRFGFLLSLNGHYQLSANYSLAYMRDNGWFVDKPQSYSYPSSSPGQPHVTRYLSEFYIGTPFVGNVLTGVDFRVVNGLHINISAGFGVRIMRSKYAEWVEGEDVYELLKSIPIETYFFNTMDFELGLSYTFPSKSNSNPNNFP